MHTWTLCTCSLIGLLGHVGCQGGNSHLSTWEWGGPGPGPRHCGGPTGLRTFGPYTVPQLGPNPRQPRRPSARQTRPGRGARWCPISFPSLAPTVAGLVPSPPPALHCVGNWSPTPPPPRTPHEVAPAPHPPRVALRCAARTAQSALRHPSRPRHRPVILPGPESPLPAAPCRTGPRSPRHGRPRRDAPAAASHAASRGPVAEGFVMERLRQRRTRTGTGVRAGPGPRAAAWAPPSTCTGTAVVRPAVAACELRGPRPAAALP